MLQVRWSGGWWRGRSACMGYGCMHMSDVVHGDFVRQLPACVTSDAVISEVRAPRYVLLVAPIALESLPVASFVVRFVQVIHALRLGGRLRSSSPHPHLSNPRLLPCCRSLCHAVSCLAVCVLLPSVLRHRHLTCTAGIDTTITAILKYTTIPANKGAEGAVSVSARIC